MYPSCPEAKYSLVRILYVRPSFSLLIGSPSTRAGVPVPEPSEGVLDVSCKSQTPSTRCPGGRREFQETRKPDMMGNRLESPVSRLGQKHGTSPHPSCAGYLNNPASSASHNDSPSSSSTTVGSSKGKISRIFPKVTSPLEILQWVQVVTCERPIPGGYTESPRSVPAQMRTPSEPPPYFVYSASSYACLKTSANQFPAAIYTGENVSYPFQLGKFVYLVCAQGMRSQIQFYFGDAHRGFQRPRYR